MLFPAQAALSDQWKTLHDQAARWRPELRLFGTVALLTVLLWLRRPDSLLNPQFWAEDAAVFHEQEVLYHFFRVAFVPYAGYLLFVARLIMAIASHFPTVAVPFVCNLISLVIASLCCSLFVLPGYRYILKSDIQRFVCCVLFACVPYCDEMSANLTNLQWYLAVGATLMLFHRWNNGKAPGLFSATLLGCVGGAIGCSSPLCIILLPFLGWKLLRPGRNERVRLALMMAGILLQAATILGQHTTGKVPVMVNGILFSIWVSYVYRVVLCTVAGISGAMWVSRHQLSSLVLITPTAVAIWLTWLYRSGDAVIRKTVVICLYLTFATLALPMLARKGMVDDYSSLTGLTAWRSERYFYLPAVLLIVLVAISTQVLWPKMYNWKSATIICLALSAAAVVNFRIPSFIDYHWAAEATKFDSWEGAWTNGRPVKGVLLRVNPPGWGGETLPSRLLAATPTSPREGCVVGTLSQAPVYFVQGGQKHPIVRPQWFSEHGLLFPDDRIFLPDSEMQALPVGAALVQ